jgi:hypothetical protein
MTPLKIVAHFKDGTLVKGTTRNFSPNQNLFHLETANGQVEPIDVNSLKAVFFVKYFLGNKIFGVNERFTSVDVECGAKRIIRVTFSDGEILEGYNVGFSSDRFGFFVRPTNKNSNNERIFVVTSATEKVEHCLSSFQPTSYLKH